MTSDEARIALSQRPPHMRTRRWLESELRYERHQGVHTWHMCDCGRMSCRGERCAGCLEEMLTAAEEKEGDA